MATIPTQELIAQLRSGLDGVTPGPWIRSGIQQKHLDQHGKFLAAGPDGALMFFSPLGRTGKDQATCIRDLDHIARCSPDNIRLLLDWNDELVATIDPDTLDAIADEIGGEFKHSARAESLRGIAIRQRSALARLTEAKD